MAGEVLPKVLGNFLLLVLFSLALPTPATGMSRAEGYVVSQTDS